MTKKLGWISLMAFLALLIPGTVLMAQEGQPERDPLLKMMEEGWKPVAPGVLQRSFEDNKVETFAVGPEGIKWTIKQLRARMAFLQKENQAYPSAETRQAIASYRKQIAKFQKELRSAKSESLESAIEKTGCSVSYSSYANAAPLTSTAGVTSNSSANFTNTCGYSATVYAEAYARATKNGVTDTFTQTDGPRSGANVSASATATIQGDSNCLSTSTSYATYSSITLSFSASNSVCPVENPAVTISGTTWESFSSYGCRSKTWTTAVSGGTAPYTYQWYLDGTPVGTGSSYSRSVCSYDDPGYTLSVTVTDSGSRTGSDTHSVSVSYFEPPPTCWQGGMQVICNDQIQ
ncbi:MAG TPA: PKD domain-containing protein [Thermoanaerobaculia bacterium]|nr:PKD domain-containing protein [Thermoanaerobaculia bacterium]